MTWTHKVGLSLRVQGLPNSVPPAWLARVVLVWSYMKEAEGQECSTRLPATVLEPGLGDRAPLPCLLHLCILKPRFLLLNFSQVKYSIGLLESKVLHLTD